MFTAIAFSCYINLAGVELCKIYALRAEQAQSIEHCDKQAKKWLEDYDAVQPQRLISDGYAKCYSSEKKAAQVALRLNAQIRSEGSQVLFMGTSVIGK